MDTSRPSLKRKITAIMAADIAEYTRITAEDEEETLARLESNRRVFDDFVLRAGGRVFNSAGDSVMCEFQSAVEATRCAIDIQESLRTRNMAYPAHRQMHFRIGISIGDVVEREGDLLGDGVNIAARLQTLAQPGSICVSRTVQEAVANKISLPFLDLGQRDVKNLPYPIHAFQIELGGGAKGAPQTAAKPGKSAGTGVFAPKITPLWLLAAVLIAAGGMGLYALGRLERTEVPPATSIKPALPPQADTGPVVTQDMTPAQAFERLEKSGGLVKAPTSAAELYHNARLLEARGENAAARRDYMALAALGREHVDPLMRLAALVLAQEGRAGAREVLGDIAKAGNRAARLAQALQFDGAERMSHLLRFAEENPDFAPAHYLLAVELGEDRQNSQTIEEKRREQAALERFLTADQEGRLVPFFLDQAVLAQWLDHTRKREATLKGFFAQGRDKISAAFTPMNTGWIGAISLPEPALQLEYQLGSHGAFRATGALQILDPRSGRPMPKTSIEFPPPPGPLQVGLRYTDAKGQLSPVTTIAFDPASALQQGMRDALERTTSGWLAFGTGQNSHRLYATHLITYRCAIEKVEIGFNDALPREVFPLPPCNPDMPNHVPPHARLFIELEPATQNATLRLTFKGGERSEVQTFARPKAR
jgi:class 3 adenylate cyclase